MEWFDHLPFPVLSVEWLEIVFLQESREGRLTRVHATDHSTWIEELLRKVGLEYQTGNSMIRVFEHRPKDFDMFDGEKVA